MKPGDLVQRLIFDYSFNKLGIPLKFSYIPAGTFTMGSPTTDTESSDGERPQNQVTISKPFLMLRTEVTQAQWKAVMGPNPSHFRGDERPVENVSWYEAVDFCNLLSRRDGLTAAYTINYRTVTLNEGATGYRLPTEAEWEYACRAGTTAPRYGDIDAIAWHSGNSSRQTHPVGQKLPNAWNLYDMLGNVFEWNWDLFRDYPTGNQTDPQGPTMGSARVLRGGGWYYDASSARAGNRFSYTPDKRYNAFGFRICRNLE